MAASGAAQANAPSLVSALNNPAMMGFALPGLTTEISVTATAGHSVIRPTGASSLSVTNLLALGDSGNVHKLTIVPASYTTYRKGNWAVGLSTGSPFTQELLPNRTWAGMFYARNWRIDTQNFTPQFAYRLAPWLYVGAGLQVQFMQVDLTQAFPASPGFPDIKLTGDSLGFGFSLGASVILPTRTVVGIGYRSAIDQTIDGTIDRPSIPMLSRPAVTVPATLTLPMPDTVNISVSHRPHEAWTLHALVEWTRWSRFGDIAIHATPPGLPGIPTEMPVRWRDAWTFAGIAEYRWSRELALRAGIRFEQGHSTDAVRVPSNLNDDRLRLLAGFTRQLTDRLSVDLHYIHQFEQRSPINVVPGHPAYTAARGSFVGEASQSAHLANLRLRYHWGEIGK